jgi:hypothetical protein
MKNLLAVAVLATASLSATAQVYEKNGNPCLGGVCAMDDLSTLAAAVKWEKIIVAFSLGTPISTVKLDEKQLHSLQLTLAPQPPMVLKAAGPFLRFHRFDADGITKLAKVKGYCEPLEYAMEGTYKSENGHNTRVVANVRGNPDGTSQLVVEMIIREYPYEYSPEQLNELHRQMRERYAGIKEGNFNFTHPSWDFRKAERRLYLYATRMNEEENRRLLKKSPGCEMKAVKVD